MDPVTNVHGRTPLGELSNASAGGNAPNSPPQIVDPNGQKKEMARARAASRRQQCPTNRGVR
jgi:hypothetical protein